MNPPIRALAAAVFVCSVVVPATLEGAVAGVGDPGLVLQLDSKRFELVAVDLRAGGTSEVISVALGSPSQPTPVGVFPLNRVVLNPRWTPGPRARARGARGVSSSLDGPMGAAKIPFASGGAIALHGGGDVVLLGKPVSGGCVRASDADLLRMISWLDHSGALASPAKRPDGEVVRRLSRPARIWIY